MRFSPLFLLLLVVTPVARAEVGVLVKQEPGEGTCLTPFILPCAAWHESGDPGNVGDDVISLHQGVEDLVIGAGPAPTSKEVDLQNTIVPIELFHQYRELDQGVDSNTPAVLAAWADLDIDERGIHKRSPMLGYDGVMYANYTTFLWNKDFLTYDYIHFPYTSYPRASDYFLDPPLFRKHCPLPFLLQTSACPAQRLHEATSTLRDALPNVILGVRIERAAVGQGATAPSEAALRVAMGGMSASFNVSPREPIPAMEQLTNELVEQKISAIVFPRSTKPAESILAKQPADGALRGPEQYLGRLLLSVLLPFVIYALYYRIVGTKILNHPTRKALQSFVAANPGADVATISDHLGLDYKTVLHHLSVLRRGQVLRISRLGRRTAVYLQCSETDALQAAALRLETRQRLLWMVQSMPGVRQAEIARRLGLSRSTVHGHVETLVRTGVLINKGGRVTAATSPSIERQGDIQENRPSLPSVTVDQQP